MQKMKYFPVFCFVMLTTIQPAGGQYTATPLKTDTYYLISNKSLPNDQVIVYSQEGKNFTMQNPLHNWRFVHEPGHWERAREGQNNANPGGNRRTGYTWIESDPPNQFKIQLLINGKFWALSCTADAYLSLVQVSPTDTYQNWEVVALDDGFYKITNVGLRNANSPYTNLFVDGNKKTLFLAAWDEAKSYNGRWFLIMAGAINLNDGRDRFDNRKMILTSASANKNMCIRYIPTSDATGDNHICACDDITADRFIFQKTINGSYLIQVEANHSGMFGGAYNFYLNNDLREIVPQEVDILNPNPYDTWNITDLGNNTFMISGSANGMVFELMKGYTGNPSQRGWGSGIPDHIEMKRWDGRNEQRWFLRE